jgi:hypothetical protein
VRASARRAVSPVRRNRHEHTTTWLSAAIALKAVRGLVKAASDQRASLSANASERQFYLGVEAAAEELLHLNSRARELRTGSIARRRSFARATGIQQTFSLSQ